MHARVGACRVSGARTRSAHVCHAGPAARREADRPDVYWISDAPSVDWTPAHRARSADPDGRRWIWNRRRTRWRGRDVPRARSQPQRGPQRPISGVRSVRTACAEGVRADCQRGGGALARCAPGTASPDRSARDWRGQRGDRHPIAPSGGCVCVVPIRHRTREADRPDLETRVLRRRRRLD